MTSKLNNAENNPTNLQIRYVLVQVQARGLGVKKHDTGFVAVQVLREAYAKNNRVF